MLTGYDYRRSLFGLEFFLTMCKDLPGSSPCSPSGTASRDRDFWTQSFGYEFVPAVERQAPTSAFANANLLYGFGEGQVPKSTGRSPTKPPHDPLRRAQPLTSGARLRSRSATKLSQLGGR